MILPLYRLIANIVANPKFKKHHTEMKKSIKRTFKCSINLPKSTPNYLVNSLLGPATSILNEIQDKSNLKLSRNLILVARKPWKEEIIQRPPDILREVIIRMYGKNC